MYVGGTWGDAIYLWNKENTRIYGFKNPATNGFAEGSVLFDLGNNVENDTIPLYYVSNIKYEDDPHDMFFADIDLIGNVENPKNDYDKSWYKEPIKKLISEYEENYKKTSVFKLKERKKLKEYLETLKGMAQAG